VSCSCPIVNTRMSCCLIRDLIVLDRAQQAGPHSLCVHSKQQMAVAPRYRQCGGTCPLCASVGHLASRCNGGMRRNQMARTNPCRFFIADTLNLCRRVTAVSSGRYHRWSPGERSLTHVGLKAALRAVTDLSLLSYRSALALTCVSHERSTVSVFRQCQLQRDRTSRCFPTDMMCHRLYESQLQFHPRRPPR